MCTTAVVQTMFNKSVATTNLRHLELQVVDVLMDFSERGLGFMLKK